MNNTRKLVFISILVAIEVILTRFLSIQTPIIRIGFGFIPVSLAAMLYGPFIGGMVGAVSDVLGMLIFPKGAFFPGFTFSAFLGGIFYGVFLYKKQKSLLNIGLAVLVITLIVNLGFNTLWLSMLTGKGVFVLIPTRAVKEMIVFPIQTFLIYIVWKYAGKYIEKNYIQEKV